MRNLALALIMVLLPSTIPAQTIGLFADSLGTDCNLQIPFPGGPVKVYALGTLRGTVASGVISAVFKVSGLPVGWSAVVTAGPQVNAMAGDPFAEGVALAYPACMVSGPLLLWTAEITPTNPVQDVDLQVAPHVQYGDSCFWSHDCGRACAHFCDCNGIPVCICAESVPSHINGAPCSVGVAKAGWGYLKIFYR